MDFMNKNDFETASYFYKKCLDVSVEEAQLKGESEAYQGLGICEENVMNIFFAMNHLETSLAKAMDGNLGEHQKMISKDLVRVYQTIALRY